MFLEQIITYKRQEVEFRKKIHDILEIKRKVQNQRTSPRDFFHALKQSGNLTRIIAEIKRASPTRGIIRREDFDPQKIGMIYQKEGAVAISVLTDNRFFQGDFIHLSLVRKVTDIPILCKDFIIDPYQIYEAALYGADAFLLIATFLSPNQIEEFLSVGQDLGMRALVEVHSEEDLEKALQTPAEIIGINNRDLKTFRTDINTTLRLAKSIPPEKLVVSESGIQNKTQIERLKAIGVHAFLVGEALMRENNPGKKLRELRGKDI
jgi:indole-3-glycerol phosphate synthase